MIIWPMLVVMAKRTIFALLLAAIFLVVGTTASNGLTEQDMLNVLDAELQDVDWPQAFNVSNFGLERRSDHPHAHLNVIELIKYYEYTAEAHKVTTEDGYIIELHRIAGNKKNPKPNGKPAVLLQHGLLCSSMDWVVTGPGRGLGFILADAGYDVWMGNARGNRYSLKHTNMTTKNSQYWEFSWHEIGKYDVPAMIDHIIKTTGNKQISYLGHSQGSTTFFVMLSERPEYNDKIKVMFSLAPVAYCSHMVSPIFQALGRLSPIINTVMGLLGRYEFKPTDAFFRKFAAWLCESGKISQKICTNVIFMICGYSEEQMDTELLPAILAHVPAGSSTKQFIHYAQLQHSGHFRQYDHGWWTNKAKYGSYTPPSYKFENIKVPVALHYAVNDWLSHPKDVEKVHLVLPNPIGKFRVPHDKFNHLDFIWAKDVKHLLYDKVLTILGRYNKT